MANGGPRIPAEPFVTWLHAQLEVLRHDETLAVREVQVRQPPINQALAGRLGISVRRLHHYLNSKDGSGNRTDTFGRYRIEDMLEHAGLMLIDVYPDLGPEDIELEPDVYCATCVDTVTPIGGKCPWCGCHPGQRPSGRPPGHARLSQRQFQALHLLYDKYQLSVPALAKEIWRKAGYASEQTCVAAIYDGFRRYDLPIRSKRDARRLGGFHAPRVQPQCAAIKRGGGRCLRASLRGSSFCLAHDPQRRGEVVEQLREMAHRSAECARRAA